MTTRVFDNKYDYDRYKRNLLTRIKELRHQLTSLYNKKEDQNMNNPEMLLKSRELDILLYELMKIDNKKRDKHTKTVNLS